MQSKSKKNPHYKTGQMVKRRIAVFCTAIMASTCVLVAEAVVKERTVALDRARIEAANISAGFEEQIRGTLNAIAGASEFLKDRIEEDEAKREAFDLIGWKSKVLELVSPGINISILDADGKVRATTLEHDPTRVSYSIETSSPRIEIIPIWDFLLGSPFSECSRGIWSYRQQGV